MAMLTKTTGLGRAVFLEVYLSEAKKVPAVDTQIVGRTLSTTQTSEIIRSMKGLGPAVPTPEGEHVVLDDLAPLFSKEFVPYLVTLGTRYSELWDYTNQYADVRAKQPMFARSFGYTRNQAATNAFFNLGFTDTSYGMNGETLFSATHATALAGTTLSNLITDVLSPLAIEKAIQILMRQKSAINQPMPVQGKLRLHVPPELYMLALRITEPTRLATTNNNDTNPLGRYVIDVVPNPYLTSTSAWFLGSVDEAENRTFKMTQLPYRIDRLAMGPDLMTTWAARESYTFGWDDWRGWVASTGTGA